MVLDPETMAPVPADGATIGELMLKGNTVMKGYLKNEDATAEAFSGGWFHTGDLGVVHAAGYVEIKDRSKDIILSGGENISSLEVEEILYRHDGVMEAAVVAQPDKMGRKPVRLRDLDARREGCGGRHRRRHHPVVPGPFGPFQGAQARRLRAASQNVHRQDTEICPAPAGQGIVS